MCALYSFVAAADVKKESLLGSPAHLVYCMGATQMLDSSAGQ